MKVEIKRYSEELKDSWDEFIVESINGNFLHSRAFFNHNPLNKEDDHSFIYLKKGKIIGCLPCVLYTEGSLILQSHPRATYGGFVVNEQVGVEEAVEMVELLISQAKKLNVKEIIVRNPFRIFNSRLCDETDYALWYKGFQVKSRELEIAIELNGEIDDLRKRFSKGTKSNVSKANKNVVINISEDFYSFWVILEENLKERYDKKPVHTLEDFHRLLKNLGEEKIKLFGGFVDGKLVCGVIVFLFNERVLHAQYIATDYAFQHFRPLNAVFDYIIDWGNKNGYAFFNVGMANEEGGKVINYGLFQFKEGFGGRGVLRETMSLKLN